MIPGDLSLSNYKQIYFIIVSSNHVSRNVLSLTFLSKSRILAPLPLLLQFELFYLFDVFYLSFLSLLWRKSSYFWSCFKLETTLINHKVPICGYPHLNSSNNLARWPVWLSLYRWWSWDSRTLSNLPKYTARKGLH